MDKKAKVGKKKQKTVPEVGVALIQATFNNTIITISDMSGNVVSWSSAGAQGFKGSRKSTPFAAQVAADKAAIKARDMGMNIIEREISRIELYQADEVFFTGTAAEVTAIVEIDNRKIGTGKIGNVTDKIRKSYADIVAGNNEKYLNWLTEVY